MHQFKKGDCAKVGSRSSEAASPHVGVFVDGRSLLLILGGFGCASTVAKKIYSFSSVRKDTGSTPKRTT
jgi:hypothetical protein